MALGARIRPYSYMYCTSSRDGVLHVRSFLTINQLMENVQGRYVSMDVLSCDVSNNTNPEDPDLEDPDEM